jgi:prevent-host-death family protein
LRAVSDSWAEVSISEAREHLADVVNRAIYIGEPTYLTRRGRRLAAIVPAERAAADIALEREFATVEACRELWLAVRDHADEALKGRVRATIDRLVAAVEDQADGAAADAADAASQAGAPSISHGELMAELGL